MTFTGRLAAIGLLVLLAVPVNAAGNRYNHVSHGRSPLNVAVSRDGKAWQAALVLENDLGEFSYPTVFQSSDGLVHATYTWKRVKVKHVAIDPAKLVLRDMPGGKWPDTN